ncbi:MAG: DNA replication/repair protein RecF [Proteobacteria bacterium]|nr:DNA replication/repair protein RecF [Pseudomonadota bacterium]
MGWAEVQASVLAADPAQRFDPAVTRLALTQFRSYASLRFDLDTPRAVVLTGPNGAGKTNLLEAVSLLAPGRGLRRATLADFPRRAASGATAREWAVAARIQGPVGSTDVGTGIDAGSIAASGDGDVAQQERRVVRIDGRPSRGAALADVVTVRWLTPAMDRMFTDAAARRRRFLDHLASGADPAHATRVSAFERTMRQRSRLLRSPGWNPRWVAALEEKMAELGTAIAAGRLEYAARLSAVMAETGAPAAGAKVVVRGDVEAWLESGPALEAEDRFRAALERGRDRDGIVGGASTGVHRSDLDVTHPNGMPAAQCSTGEQKTLLFAIIEADVRLVAAAGKAPLLLLDEVSAHLDEERRAALFDAVLTLGSQVWATGTDASLFAGLAGRAQFHEVREGRVIPVRDR